SAMLEAVIVCPSNPYLSVDPVLAVPGVRALLRAHGVPVIAVSPIVRGRAVKGPTPQIMGGLGLAPSPLTIAQPSRAPPDGFVLDRADQSLADRIGCATLVTDTVMHSLADRERLAGEVLAFAARLRASRAASG